jgi:hypothetical protein
VSFDLSRIPDDSCAEGHLDGQPIPELLLALHQAEATGRLTLADASGPNHLYFLAGSPVGVKLAEAVSPLGQLLLELGRIDGATFVRAQRLIAEAKRPAREVLRELASLDDDAMQDVLAVQARKKTEQFCRLDSRPFTFCKGASFLTGFTASPLDLHAVIYLAVRQQMGPALREAWLDGARDVLVRARPVDGQVLPAPAAVYGFTTAEERVLSRLAAGYVSVTDLVDTGTLPRDELAVLLRYLERMGRLERHEKAEKVEKSEARPRARLDIPREKPAIPAGFDDVFSAVSTPPVAMPVATPLATTSPAPDPVFAGPSEPTNPRLHVGIHDQRTQPVGQAVHEPRVQMPVAEAPPPSLDALHDAPVPVVRKKKVKRAQALPSEGAGTFMTETRREKTMITKLPTILIADDD